MLTARGGTRITVPVAEVFDFLADARNEISWLPGAARVRLTSTEPVAAGSTFVGQYARAGTVTLTITRYERPSRLTIAGEAKALTFTDEIELEQSGDATQLSATMTTTPRGIFRSMAPMMGRVIEKQFAANWDALRVRLEPARP